jgi:hypothetical protein
MGADLEPFDFYPEPGTEGWTGDELELRARMHLFLDRVEARPLAIYDDGYPAGEEERWLLFGAREAISAML